MLEQPSLRRKQEERKHRAPLLSDYLDYREYLKDFYDYKRQEPKTGLRSYNYAVFSASAGIKSPNYLKMIIDGKRNLSDDMIFKFAKALRLTKSEGLEFQALVRYSQATEANERNQYLRDLADLRVRRKLESGEIDRSLWQKVPGWVSYVIHAMIPPQGMSGDVHKILKLFNGKALLADVEAAIEALVHSGVVERNADDGWLHKKSDYMEGLENIPPSLVRKLQAELMYLGLESMFRDPPSEREMGTLTLSLSSREFEEIKFQLRKLRKSLMKDNLTKAERQSEERVYQINLQLYPLTEPIKCAALSDSTELSTIPLEKNIPDL